MSADADLATAILTRWNSSALLASIVPGGLQMDALTGAQDDDALTLGAKAMPYAKLEIVEERAADHSSGGDRIEYHKVTLTAWGLGRKDLGSVVTAIRGIVEAGGWVVDNTAVVMAVYPQAGMGAVKEEQTKSGDKVLKATIPYVFWLHRTAL